MTHSLQLIEYELPLQQLDLAPLSEQSMNDLNGWLMKRGRPNATAPVYGYDPAPYGLARQTMASDPSPGGLAEA